MTSNEARDIGVDSTVEYVEENGSLQADFDNDARSVTDTVIEAVAVATERDPISLPPLQRTIDADTLDSLFAPTESGIESSIATLTVEYADRVVTVSNRSTVHVTPL